ncbi:uncharacterized protein LOC110459333 [Mizuhopecten yessoensis]|uniref:uncharacterized protein LOC110459333 n=1 Tax=Mizuhopecten yessoensis TaxID=6573 RepID=UPI000B45B237|nr:uncharacterized protein LOC110459333 [Mizuhopecten yessoensis]
MSAASHLHDALNREHVDICGTAEHWLFEENRHLFGSIHKDYESIAISDFSLHPLADKRSRKGGVAIMWYKRFNDRVSVVESDDDRIVIIKLVTDSDILYFIQVYLPTSRYGVDIFTDYVEKLDDLCTTFSLEVSVILMGDFNARLSGPRIPNYQNQRGQSLQRLIDRHQLCALSTADICVGPLHSYVHSEDGSSSLIDHIIINSSKVDLVWECAVLDRDFLDVPNHRPLLCELHIPLPVPRETFCNTLTRVSYRWITSGDSKNVDVYRDSLDECISNSSLVNMQELCSEDDVENYTNELVNCIQRTSERVLPKRKFCRFLKPYWNNHLKELHRNMWRLRLEWISQGRPRDPLSNTFRLYKNAKCLFRKRHRQVSEDHIVNLNNDIEKCADVNQKSFWSLIKSRCKSSSGAVGAEMNFSGRVIRDPALLAIHWGEYFEDIYSQSSLNDFDANFADQINTSVANILSNHIVNNECFVEISMSDVKKVCKSLPQEMIVDG